MMTKHSIFGKISNSDSQAVVDSIQQDDVIKGIEIDGNIKFDQDLQESVDSWNKIIDQIML